MVKKATGAGGSSGSDEKMPAAAGSAPAAAPAVFHDTSQTDEEAEIAAAIALSLQ